LALDDHFENKTTASQVHILKHIINVTQQKLGRQNMKKMVEVKNSGLENFVDSIMFQFHSMIHYLFSA
jgi:hypothetical protein